MATSKKAKQSSCGGGAADCAAGTCVLCTCCPLALIWCCVLVPFKVVRHTCEGIGRRRGTIVRSSSSFSDIDFNAGDAEMTSPDEKRVKVSCFELFQRRRCVAASARGSSLKVSFVTVS